MAYTAAAPRKVEACLAYALHYLADCCPENIVEKAQFWDVDVSIVKDWFPAQSYDHIKGKAFTDLSFFSQRRVVCNACASYYAERLLDYSNRYHASVTPEQLSMREQRVIDTNKLLTSEKEVRDSMADAAHITPLRRPNKLLNDVRSILKSRNYEWADSFISPSINKAEREESDRKRIEHRNKGVLRVDLQPVVDWALKVLSTPTQNKPGELATALSIAGGRRSVELVSPRFIMARASKNRVVMNTQAKQQNEKQLYFETLCSASIFVARREQLQGMYTWGDLKQNTKSLNCVKASVRQVIKGDEFEYLRQAYIKQYDRFVPHDLRKCYAAYMLHQKRTQGLLPAGEEHTLEYIQSLLGHSNLESSRTYNRLSHAPPMGKRKRDDVLVEAVQGVIERELSSEEKEYIVNLL